jgi:hypothetical protein
MQPPPPTNHHHHMQLPPPPPTNQPPPHTTPPTMPTPMASHCHHTRQGQLDNHHHHLPNMVSFLFFIHFIQISSEYYNWILSFATSYCKMYVNSSFEIYQFFYL